LGQAGDWRLEGKKDERQKTGGRRLQGKDFKNRMETGGKVERSYKT
jgi:hypothetical protein